MPTLVITEFDASSEAFQSLMNEWQDAYNRELVALAKELQVSEHCAMDILYLRTRSRWTQELESELIALHAAGNPPNICDFGVTIQTQQNLMNLALAELNQD